MTTRTISVQTTIVSSEDGAHTYEVRKTLLDEAGNPASGRDAVLIGLYPTTTAEEPYRTDLSTNHLICKMPELGLRSVRILNLFSHVCESEKLSAKGLEEDEENLAYIQAVMEEPDFQNTLCIIAWGNSMASCKAANRSKARIARTYRRLCPDCLPCQLTAPSLALESGECAHVLYMGIRHKRETWDLCEYRFPDKDEPEDKPEKKKTRKKAALKSTEPKTAEQQSSEPDFESPFESSTEGGEAV